MSNHREGWGVRGSLAERGVGCCVGKSSRERGVRYVVKSSKNRCEVCGEV